MTQRKKKLYIRKYIDVSTSFAKGPLCVCVWWLLTIGISHSDGWWPESSKAPRQGAQLWSGWSQSSVRSLGCCRKGGRGLIWTWPFTFSILSCLMSFFWLHIIPRTKMEYISIYESFLVQRLWMFVRGAVWVQVLAIRSMALIDPSAGKTYLQIATFGPFFLCQGPQSQPLPRTASYPSLRPFYRQGRMSIAATKCRCGRGTGEEGQRRTEAKVGKSSTPGWGGNELKKIWNHKIIQKTWSVAKHSYVLICYRYYIM